MSRTERLLELMLRLRTMRHFTVQELANELHVSRRTMLRDLQALSVMGVPLAATPGPHGGYFLLQKQLLLPLSLTEDEALGMLLSYESLVEYADAPFAVQSLSAITKLCNALPPDVVSRLERLRAHIVMSGTQRDYTAPLLTELLQAAIDEVHLNVKYESRSQTAERLIYPYGLYATDGFWYCACFDHKRQQHVSLRADRVLSLQHVEGLIEGLTQPAKMSLRAWLQVNDPEEEPLLELHVTINKQGMKHLNWRAFLSNLALDNDGNGIIQQHIPLKELDFYARQFLPLGSDAIIASPPELIEAIKHRAHAILACYE